MIEQAKFAYSLSRKAFKKQIKTIEEQGKKQVEALKALREEELESIEGLFPNNMRNMKLKMKFMKSKNGKKKLKKKI